MNTQMNWVGVVIAIVVAICAWFLSPEFAAENFGLNPDKLGTVKLIATIVSIAVGAYNGYQINAKTAK